MFNTNVIVEVLFTALPSWLFFSEECLLELIVSVLLSPWPPSVDITRELGFDFDLLLIGGYSYIDEKTPYKINQRIYTNL